MTQAWTQFKGLGLPHFKSIITYKEVAIVVLEAMAAAVAAVVVAMIAAVLNENSFIHSFIHSVVCLTTGPKLLPKRALHIVRSRASSFK